MATPRWALLHSGRVFGWRALAAPLEAAAKQSVGLGPGDRSAPTLPFGEQLDADGRPLLPGAGTQDPFVRDVGLARLWRLDPAFDPAVVIRATVEAFLAAEDAWQRLDPQHSRPYLSSPLWASQCARMELFALHGRRNVLAGLVVRSGSVVGCEVDEAGGTQRLTVRIAARSADFDVDTTTAAVVRGDRVPFDWSEDWTVQRTVATGGAVAALKASAGTGENPAPRCPGCGAPLQRDDAGRCTSCHAQVEAQPREWVVVGAERVDEAAWRLRATLGVGEEHLTDDRGHIQVMKTVTTITNLATAPRAEAAHNPAAVATLHATDAGLDIPALAAHAVAAMLAWRRALAAQDAEVVRPFLTEGTYAGIVADIAATAAAGQRYAVAEPATAEAHLADAADADGVLRARFMVLTELDDAILDAAGRPVSGSTELQHRLCPLELRRRAGARSRDGSGSVLRCPRCGAPLRAATLQPCPFCRQAVADGGGDWAVDVIGPLQADTRGLGAGADATPTAAPVVATRPPGVLDPLRAGDPGLNEAELLADVRQAFYVVETSLGRLDTSSCAPVVTEELRAQLDARVGELRAQQHHRVLAFIDVAAATPVAARVENGALHATVRLDVSGQDYERDDATGATAAGAATTRRWQEDWSVTRTAAGQPWRVEGIAPVAS